jgi:hypothetical protein
MAVPPHRQLAASTLRSAKTIDSRDLAALDALDRVLKPIPQDIFPIHVEPICDQVCMTRRMRGGLPLPPLR